MTTCSTKTQYDSFSTVITNSKTSCSSNLRPSELYEVQECVGKGNFGDVYKAIDKSTGNTVAIKVVNLEETDDEIDLLAQEIYFLAELRSPYITNYFSTFVEDVSMWIVMEYCGGGSCSDLLKCLPRGTLTEEKVAFITREILRGLEYLHSQRKIHRDIKAANILLTDDGKVKLGDFGVSGQMMATRRRDTFVGTPFWMAPEVIARSEQGYNEKADIWSLGITVFELLKGQPPLSQHDPMKVLMSIPSRRPPKLEDRYSHAIREFVSLCLNKDPAKRPTASELLKHRFIARVGKKGVENLKEEVDLIKGVKVKAKYSKNPKFSISDKVYKTGRKRHLETWNFKVMKKEHENENENENENESENENKNENKNGHRVIGAPAAINAGASASAPKKSGKLARVKRQIVRLKKEQQSPDSQECPDSGGLSDAGKTSDTNVTTPTVRGCYALKRPGSSAGGETVVETGIENTTEATAENTTETATASETETETTSEVDNRDSSCVFGKELDYYKDIMLYSFKRIRERARGAETKAVVDHMQLTFQQAERDQPGLSEALVEEIYLRMDSIKGLVDGGVC